MNTSNRINQGEILKPLQSQAAAVVQANAPIRFFETEQNSDTGLILERSVPQQEQSVQQQAQIPKRINLEEYTLEALQSKYPEDEGYFVYQDDDYGECYVILNNKLVLIVTQQADDGVMIERLQDNQSDYTETICDPAGRVLRYTDDVNGVFYRNETTQVRSTFELPNGETFEYTGARYHIEIENDIIRGTNEDTGKEFVIDLNQLVSMADENNKAGLKHTIGGLPGEVLEDLSVESTTITSKYDKNSYVGKNAAGVYRVDIDSFATRSNSTTLIHELGHALDNCRSRNETRDFMSTHNEDFLEALELELQAYETAGNKRATSLFGGIVSEVDGNYCTLNEKEMFAECYTLLMTGDCNSKDVILRYFPETLKQTEILLGQIRALNDEQRHQDVRIESLNAEMQARALLEKPALTPDDYVNLRRLDNDLVFSSSDFKKQIQDILLAQGQPQTPPVVDIDNTLQMQHFTIESYGDITQAGENNYTIDGTRFSSMYGQAQDGSSRNYYWIDNQPVSIEEFLERRWQ